MNKTKKIIGILLISLLVLSIAPISVWAKNQTNQAVLTENENTASVQSNSNENQSPSEAAAQKIDSSKVMKALSLSSGNMKSFKTADDKSDIKYTAKFDDGSAVDFDKDMNIISYCNFDRKSENSQTSNEKIINILKQEYHIDETYNLNVSYEANEKDKDDTVYYWQKTEENGVQNPYDALTVRINGITNEIVLFRRFNASAELPKRTDCYQDSADASVSEDEAKKIALNVKEEFNKVTSCEKVYVKANYFWNEGEYSAEKNEPVRLVYNVEIDNRFYVYVDTETGDILGGDMKKCISK